MSETPKTCATCIFTSTCPIFRVARETQIANIQADMFGCMWHTTKEQYEAESAKASVSVSSVITSIQQDLGHI
jgi:hypothetical protein